MHHAVADVIQKFNESLHHHPAWHHGHISHNKTLNIPHYNTDYNPHHNHTNFGIDNSTINKSCEYDSRGMDTTTTVLSIMIIVVMLAWAFFTVFTWAEDIKTKRALRGPKAAPTPSRLGRIITFQLWRKESRQQIDDVEMQTFERTTAAAERHADASSSEAGPSSGERTREVQGAEEQKTHPMPDSTHSETAPSAPPYVAYPGLIADSISQQAALIDTLLHHMTRTH